jgi:NAD(P)-dependent dehydrogenase (short-subunit alcohol dehydrogenase family)
MASYLVTGSSRGLGLALVSRLASLPAAQVGKIIATARQDNSPQLTEIVKASSGRVELVKLDVTNKSSIQEAAKLAESKLQGKGLDYLINNVGLTDYAPAGLEGMDNLNEIFHTNVTSVHNVTQGFLPLLRKGQKKVVINM